MPKNPPPPVASRVAADGTVNEFRKYNDWFLASPNPWNEIAGLEYGADRTFTSTIRTAILASEPAERPGMEARLLQAMARPGITDAGRMFVCRMLALIGTVKCVPALAPLLHDARTTDAARYALDAITDPAVDELYREALENVRGSARSGLIGSIAQRGDITAVPALTRIKQDETESAEVRAAATRALNRLKKA